MLSSVRDIARKTARVGLLSLISFSSIASALNLSGITNSHDPSTLVKDGDTYFHFTTGDGVWYSRSTDMVNWGNPGTVFNSGWPSWINNAVPGFGGHFWAPDIIQMGDYFYLYYSASSFGSSRSAIGVARTASLKKPNWEDLGPVVQSYGGNNEINAIDAALFRDHDGRVYMSYGSWFGGLGVAEVNQSTGKLSSSVQHIFGGGHQSIEAPYITRNGDYYYLFFTRGNCCQGVNSTYRVQVARSTSVFGPYTGERNLMPNVSGNRKGPGHVGIIKQDGCNYTTTHYYDLNQNGTAKLDIQRMDFVGGWPTMTSNFNSIHSCGGYSEGLYQLQSRNSGKALEIEGAVTDNGTTAVQYDFNDWLHQKWYLVDHGTGTYSLINAWSQKSLDVWEQSSANGADIAQWEYWGGPGQKWRLNSVGSNMVEIESDMSNKLLDVSGRSTANGANVLQWQRTGASNQHWRLLRQ
ncbi:family 43 glycosylhydrolase [Gilvimarinus sp. SDUM040013]|uniref:Family 43 glycosylhydrolase n=1 Tax=Gilvimarinus gilvus TaxID=3058038 RepID=A0ABU4S0L4_9GAMM|nr:family 43 glycosylhydrolase [Gilvimarinus sp. SDUM040013]MDO3385622.1 family 43 glycosylhydrolase [Gilvimarinus sp. SDUM040013]MDX6849956.1 family 43 glycosylhydrolase [Gilvimarinus sp. SDUM040013]